MLSNGCEGSRNNENGSNIFNLNVDLLIDGETTDSWISFTIFFFFVLLIFEREHFDIPIFFSYEYMIIAYMLHIYVSIVGKKNSKLIHSDAVMSRRASYAIVLSICPSIHHYIFLIFFVFLFHHLNFRWLVMCLLATDEKENTHTIWSIECLLPHFIYFLEYFDVALLLSLLLYVHIVNVWDNRTYCSRTECTLIYISNSGSHQR